MNQSRNQIYVPLPLKSVIKNIVFDTQALKIHVLYYNNGDLVFMDFISRNLTERLFLKTGQRIDHEAHFTHALPPPVGKVFRDIAYQVSGSHQKGHDFVPHYRDEVNHEDVPHFEATVFTFFENTATICAEILDPNNHFFDQ